MLSFNEFNMNVQTKNRKDLEGNIIYLHMTVADPTILNLQDLEQTTLQTDPYPYMILKNFIDPAFASGIMKDFPSVSFGGSVPLPELEFGETFGRLIEELEGDALRTSLEKKFSMDLKDRPTFITVRGRTRAKDGRIHTDTKSKLLTLLLYFNPEWNMEQGKLRILRSGTNLDDYVAEIEPVFGTCLIFKVTDNCWHGHKPYDGERRAIQLNYLTDRTALKQHLSKHQFSARLKSLKRWFSHEDQY